MAMHCWRRWTRAALAGNLAPGAATATFEDGRSRTIEHLSHEGISGQYSPISRYCEAAVAGRAQDGLAPPETEAAGRWGYGLFI